MNQSKWILLTAVFVSALATPSAASAHRHWHGHGEFGVFVGPRWVDPWYYPPSYPYPPVVVMPAPQPAPPPVYIERGTAPSAGQPQQAYWYYCANPQGYYPYVKECPGGWQPVAPQPPSVP